MARSQNGWTASPDRQRIEIENATLPGTKVNLPQGVKRGDVTTVLFYVAKRFHDEVEPLKDGWCWGYHYKRIEGSSSLSNHASGTAIDLNAPNHPMGKKGTFSADQVKAIRRILNDCDGVVRWGGDYSGRVDEMHFEIVKDESAVARLAAKIRDGQLNPKPLAKPEKLAEDGILGPKTIRRWQQVMGTEADGVISNPSELVKAVQRHLNSKIKAGLKVDGIGIRQDGRRYETALALQKYLKTEQDGIISKPKSEVVKALQKRLNTGKF